MAEILKTNGERVTVTPQNGTDFKLAEMQEIVGGRVEMVYLPGSRRLIVHEEGSLRRLPFNQQATSLYRLGPIYGDVLLCFSDQVR